MTFKLRGLLYDMKHTNLKKYGKPHLYISLESQYSGTPVTKPTSRSGVPDLIKYQTLNIITKSTRFCEPGSSVGIVTDYGLDGPEIESRWGGARFFAPVQTGPGAHPTYCTMGTGSFLGVNCGRGVLLTTHPLLVPRSWKSKAIPLPTLWATSGL
jgi:hypothetical protein